MNVREELIEQLTNINKKFSDIECGFVYIKKDNYENERGYFFAREDKNNPEIFLYKDKELENIPSHIIYDAGYGSQELFGLILFIDGTWLERGEYDGSEWWEYKKPLTRKIVEEELHKYGS